MNHVYNEYALLVYKFLLNLSRDPILVEETAIRDIKKLIIKVETKIIRF